MFSKEVIAFAASISTASAAIYQGFNYDSSAPFTSEFALAKTLAGTDAAFTSARLYTMIEPNTVNTPTSAISAAIAGDVSLLLGLWASAGQAAIDNEIAALKSAISTYGTELSGRIVGISVGSEDLYRISPTGIINLSGAGAEPTDLISYISQVRTAIAGTVLADVPVGHVDTWTAWVNGSNFAVTSVCDFLGMDAYPYFQTTESNGIGNAYDLFFSAYDQTVADAQGKPVWVTETGWPASGPNANDAVPSVANAETYWQEVACKLLGTTNTWWYTLNDYGASPSFGLTTGSSTPIYNLACSASSSSSSSSASASSTSATSSGTTSASAVASTTASSSAASLSAHESTATPSNSIVPVTSSAVASQAGGGSPADKSSAAADNSAASLATASPSVASSALSVASVAANSTVTTPTSLPVTVSPSASAGSASAASASSGVATSSAASASSASASAASASGAASGSSSATASAPVASYTGAASTLRSTGGFVAALVAMVAAF